MRLGCRRRRTPGSRTLMSFLPPSEGAAIESMLARRERDRFVFDQVPWNIIPPFLLQLAGEPGDRIRAAFGQRGLTLRRRPSAGLAGSWPVSGSDRTISFTAAENE